MTDLSEHFTLSEAVKSQLADRNGIDNTPPPGIAKNLVRVAVHILEPVRAEYSVPFSPSSWYRSPELNARLGSKPTSQHVLGLAVDFELPGVSNAELATWCSENLTFDQLILEFYKTTDPKAGWVHCSITEEGAEPRGQVLTVSKDGVHEGLP